jgi:hypothetical protein
MGQPLGFRKTGDLQPGPWAAYFADDPQNQDNDNGNNDECEPHARLEYIADDLTTAHGNHQQDE